MITVHSINESIRSFIANDDKEWYDRSVLGLITTLSRADPPACPRRLELPPMNKKQRVMVHQLSQLYHLKSKSYGSGTYNFAMSSQL
jgi:hypothetical protein